jgi:cytochrome c oxidase cbb3-type subunit 3
VVTTRRNSPRASLAATGLFIGIAVALCGCKQGRQSSAPNQAQTLPPEGALNSLPLGALAGGARLGVPDNIANPLAGNDEAIAAGHQLFMEMNCAGCHGYDAKGGMGPNLTDKYWRYGGMPSSIYNSIYAGRPQGMPAWGKALPPQDIWRLVTFIQSLGGTVSATYYQVGLEGDHDISSVAPEVPHSLGDAYLPAGVAAVTGSGERLSAPTTSPSQSP